MVTEPVQRPSPSPVILYAVSGLILVGFIAFVEIYFGWGQLLRPWLQLPYEKIVIAVMLVFISYWVRALRLYDYFRYEMHGRFMICFKLMLQHNLLNNLLPMRSGELSFPLLMSRYFNVPMTRSIAVLLGFRLLDLHTLILFFLGAMAFHGLHAVIITLAILLWCTLPPIAFRFSRQLAFLLDGHGDTKVYALLRQSLSGLPQTSRHFYMAWLWTVINWAVKLGVFAWILMLFIDVPAAAAWSGAITGDFTSVLPIHGLAGAGTYEAGVIAGLLPFAIPASSALQGAVNLHVFILGATLIGGAFSLLPSVDRRHG